MTLLASVREVQIPLLAAMLLGAGSAKILRALRAGSAADALGPTAMFPVYLRRPVAAALCIVEFSLGLGLVLTAGGVGAGSPATAFRLASGTLFVVITCALIELRATRPEVGCGCFGDLSTAPVSQRTLARSALLALAGFATIGLKPIDHVPSAGAIAELLAILFVEMLLFGALSPEIGEGLIRLGYSEPCELRDVPSQRTVAALRRSRLWRRYSSLITSDVPADVWRELCWRYVVYPARHEGRAADLVFAIYLQQRRPAIRAALVDSATGQTLPWPGSQAGRVRVRQRHAPAASPVPASPVPASPVPASPVAVGLATAPAEALRAEIPVSTDV